MQMSDISNMDPWQTQVSYKVVANIGFNLVPNQPEGYQKGEVIADDISTGAMLNALMKGRYTLERGGKRHELRVPEDVKIVAVLATVYVKEVELTPDVV